MKDTKRRFETFTFYDHSGIAAHLEKMALKGWFLERFGAMFWIYRKAASQVVHYAVIFNPIASEFDPEHTEAQETFNEFCRHTGWEFVASSGQMQIFYNFQANPVPIHTDPMLELQNIQRSAKKSSLPIYAILLCCSLAFGLIWVRQLLRDPLAFLSEGADLAAMVSVLILFLFCVIEIGGYYVWRFKAHRAARHGVLLRTKGSSIPVRIIEIVVMGLLLWQLFSMGKSGDSMRLTVVLTLLIGQFVLRFIVNAVREALKNSNVTTDVTRMVTLAVSIVLSLILVFGVIPGVNAIGRNREAAHLGSYYYQGLDYVTYHDTLPLSLEDLASGDYTQFNKRLQENESILMAMIDGHQWSYPGVTDLPATSEIDYTVIVAKAPFLYGFAKDYLYQKEEQRDDSEETLVPRNIYEPIDASPWGADEAYQLMFSGSEPIPTYLLCYDDRIVEITFNWTPAQEQMTVVGEKMGR
jgi:hypothetical protein